MNAGDMVLLILGLALGIFVMHPKAVIRLIRHDVKPNTYRVQGKEVSIPDKSYTSKGVLHMKDDAELEAFKKQHPDLEIEEK